MGFLNIFSKLFANKTSTPDFSGPVPGAMGKLLASMGVNEIGDRPRAGVPLSVLNGCQKEHVLVPGATRPAVTREGKPVLVRNKAGRLYQAMDNYAVTRKQWKQMVNDQKRKEAGRWYSGKKAA